LNVPYTHVIFTLPHQLNGLARENQSLMYFLIMKVSWLTIKAIGKKYNYTPGMTSILHTFGSDLNYHIHVHALVTFGGVNKENNWQTPYLKTKLERYRTINKIYKDIFISFLKKYKGL